MAFIVVEVSFRISQGNLHPQELSKFHSTSFEICLPWIKAFLCSCSKIEDCTFGQNLVNYLQGFKNQILVKTSKKLFTNKVEICFPIVVKFLNCYLFFKLDLRFFKNNKNKFITESFDFLKHSNKDHFAL